MKRDQSSFTLLDGPLLPNDAIEGAEAITLDAPDDLVVCGDGSLLVSDGAVIKRIVSADGLSATTIAELGGAVTAMCRLDDDTVAVAVDGKGLFALPASGGQARLLSDGEPLRSAITACTAADGGLLVTKAATGGVYPYTQELFTARGTGQLLKVAPDGRCTVVADGLRGPHGVMQTASGEIVISETWGAALRVVEPDGRVGTVLSGFAGYPGRLSALANGGYLIACLSRRDALVDFICTETAFSTRMMREIDPAHWVAPRLQSAIDVNVPAQSGATRLFGEIKPWAPSLSYGLVAVLNDDFVPQASYHSRANGVRHGIVSAVEWDGRIAAVSKATSEVLFMQSRSRADDR